MSNKVINSKVQFKAVDEKYIQRVKTLKENLIEDIERYFNTARYYGNLSIKKRQMKKNERLFIEGKLSIKLDTNMSGYHIKRTDIGTLGLEFDNIKLETVSVVGYVHSEIAKLLGIDKIISKNVVLFDKKIDNDVNAQKDIVLKAEHIEKVVDGLNIVLDDFKQIGKQYEDTLQEIKPFKSNEITENILKTKGIN
ncbi:hypothetical protein ACR56S_03675 [Staphylococcus hominis]|uniref:hypothetical protein n=1 Tax=Staphylococcus hominis TaxID=1290 RepID=UPI003DA05580